MLPASQSADDGPAATPPFRLAFGSFLLDAADARLWHDGRAVPLRPRAFDLLRVLAERAGQLVTKDELLDAVWGTRFVTEGVIKTAVGELREALGEDPKRPQWIETVPRRGYRFLAPSTPWSGKPTVADRAIDPTAATAGRDTVAPAPATVPATAGAAASPPQTVTAVPPALPLVGRDDALASLSRAWQAVLGGERRVVFLSGDPGVGKTMLASAFVERLREGIAAHGQCVESFGRGEAYLPWLEALASFLSAIDDLPALLRRYAPNWLAQLPWLQTEADRAAAAPAGGNERMPREMATLLEQIGQRQPLVLVLEDLHWSDHASVQLLDFVARRRAPARVLLLATFRATELLLAEHPLAGVRRELRLHRLAEEIGLDGLDAAGLRRLLTAWCPGVAWSSSALAALQAHTEGVPLFARAVVDALAADGVLQAVAAGRWRLAGPLPQPLPLPDNLAGLFEKQLLALEPAQRELLEAAAVAGVEFDAAVLAAAIGRDRVEVHARCDGLVRGGRWLQAAGIESRASGPASGRYRFGHALMQSLCYARCGAARRVELHRRVAAALIERHGDRGDELAAELAYHFERALDADAALPQLRRAIGQARQRQAAREVLDLAERALALLPQLSPGTDADTRRRLSYGFSASAATAGGLLHGYASTFLGELARRAVAAGHDRPLDEELINLHRILWLHLVANARHDEALALAEALTAQAGADAPAGRRILASSMLHFSAFKCGAFERAREVLASEEHLAPQAVAPDALYAKFFAQQAHERRLVTVLLDELQGRPPAPDAAAVLDMPPELHSPMTRVLNGVLCGLWLAWRGDAPAVAHGARAILALIEQEELHDGAGPHRMLLHWAEGALGAPTAARAGLHAALAALGSDRPTPDRAAFLELAADLALRAADVPSATSDLDAAFAHVHATGERYILPRLWRRRAQIAEARGDPAAAVRARELERRAQAAPADALDDEAAPRST